MFINNKGVTLVEVMISLVIFLIVFMGLMQTALLSIDGNVRNVERDEAIMIANGELDYLRNVPFDSLNVGTNCDATDKYKRKFRNLEKQYNVCDIITDIDTGANDNTRRIEVVIGWNHKNETAVQTPTNREFQHSITTVRRRG